MRVMDFISQPWVIFWGIFGVIVVTFVVITIIERRLNAQAVEAKKRAGMFKKKMNAIRRAESSEKALMLLSEMFREHYAKKFMLGEKASGLEVLENLKTKNDIAATEFYQKMQEAMYSGEGVTRAKVIGFVEKFEELVYLDRRREKGKSKMGFGRRVKLFFRGLIGIIRREEVRAHDEIEDLKEEINRAGKRIHKTKKDKHGKIGSFDDLSRMEEWILTKKGLAALDRSKNVQLF